MRLAGCTPHRSARATLRAPASHVSPLRAGNTRIEALMKLILTQVDLDGMPAGLRQELFLYLGQAVGPSEPAELEVASLDREHVIALLREISFHRSGAKLRVLIDRLAHGDAARPPSRQRMTEALESDGVHLGRYVATLNRIAAKVTGQPGIRLCQYHHARDAYMIHPATRHLLRDVLAAVKASGKKEEPLWE